jgi:AraC-like DNA-binding protein
VQGLEARYRRFPPPPELDDHVEHVWMVEAPGSVEPKREILIPNGRPSVVVCLATPGVRYDSLTGTAQPNRSVAFGITTRPYVLEQQGTSSYVGAQLTPWGLSALLPRTWLVDAFLPLGQWLGEASADELARRLVAEEFGPPRAAVLAAFLRSRIVPIEQAALESLKSMVTAIDTAQGVVSVRDLSAELGISYSSLYRLCKHYLGVGPKEFCEVTRYYHFVGGLLGETGGGSDALLASLHGYYDQAHAARSFKRFTGVSATSFKKINHGIARLMHS